MLVFRKSLLPPKGLRLTTDKSNCHSARLLVADDHLVCAAVYVSSFHGDSALFLQQQPGRYLQNPSMKKLLRDSQLLPLPSARFFKRLRKQMAFYGCNAVLISPRLLVHWLGWGGVGGGHSPSIGHA